METNGNQRTWVTYEEDRNDFSPKSSVDEFVKHKEIYRDSANAIRSQADIFLTEIEKQLEVTESKYESAMKRLRYTKMLYGNAAGSMSLETNDYDRTDDSTINQKNSQSDASSSARLVDDKSYENNLLTSGTTQYLEETQNTQNKAPEESDTKNLSTEQKSKSFKIASSSNSFQNINAEDHNDTNDQSYTFERTKGSEINFQFMKDTLENRGTDNVNQIREEHFLNDISSRRVHPYQLHLAEYSKGLHEQFEEESRNAESPTLENHDIYTSDLNPSMQEEPRKAEKHVNPAGSIQSFQMSKKIKKNRHDKQRKTISSKIVSKSIDDSMGQTVKKKKLKKRALKTSNSRCTTATKETSISENKKETRWRPKAKGHSTLSNLQLSQNRRPPNVITKNQNNMSDLVELYHNRVLRSGSLSVVSSKHTKVMETRIRGFNNGTEFDQPWRTKGSHRLVENNEKRIFDNIAEQRSKKQEANELNQTKNEKFCHDDESCRDHLQGTTDLRSGEPNRMNYEADCPAVNQSENNTIKEYRDDVNQQILQDCQSPHILPPSFDPFSARNYASPTQSSRMKQVHRSFFNRFNFRNIPFVVGTSVTPSYNLGLNIQEALSLMKTRQLMPSRISPMLISNVSKGLKPVSALFECIKDERVPLMEERNVPFTINSRGMTSLCQGSVNEEKTSKPMQMTPFSLKSPGLRAIPDTETLYKAQESSTNPKFELTPKKQKTQSICSSMKFNNQKSLEPKLELTQSFLLRQRQEELNMGESTMGKWQNETQGSKGIREVLMNFSDQYESMIKKFEKLQEQSKKSNDKSLEKEIAALEKELNSKEEEIKAVASLYQEVMILKRQMRMLYERNSLVCVSTEAPGNPTYPHLSMRAQTANPIRMINVYRRGGFVNNQGPPTSTKLAGMLRQIKTFQKHLKSDT